MFIAISIYFQKFEQFVQRFKLNNPGINYEVHASRTNSISTQYLLPAQIAHFK